MSLEDKIDQAKGALKEGLGKVSGDKKIQAFQGLRRFWNYLTVKLPHFSLAKNIHNLFRK